MQPLCFVSNRCIPYILHAKKHDHFPLPQRQEWRRGGEDGGTEGLPIPLVAAAAALALSTSCFVSAPVAYCQSLSNGAALFQKACIGCHDMGGNILQPGATLFFKDLQRNGVETEEGIYNITYYGKGRMPASSPAPPFISAAAETCSSCNWSCIFFFFRDLERNAPREVNARLGHGCRRTRLNSWQSS